MNSSHASLSPRSSMSNEHEMIPMDTMALLGEKKEQVVSWVKDRTMNPRSISEVCMFPPPR